MRFYWFLALCFGIALSVFMIMPDSRVSITGGDTYLTTESCDLSTPRAAFRSFLVSMRSYNRDSHTGFDCLSRVISSSEDKNTIEYKSDILKKASGLFLILENINYDLDKDIPAEAAGDKISFPLKLKGKPLSIAMVRGPEGWHFDNSMLEDPDLQSAARELRQRYAKFTSENMEGDTFVQDLMSPYRTFFTLQSGVEGKYSDSLDRAVAALDLSAYSHLERPVYGPILAVILYRLITKCTTIHLEKLSADPDSDYAPVFMVVPDLGSITMHVVTLENGRKAWQFTPNSLQVAWKTYDRTMQILQKEGNNPFIGNNLPLHMIIDDYVQRNYPDFMVRYLNTNLYKWIILFGLFLLTPVVAAIISYVGNKGLLFVEKRLPDGVALPNRRKLMLPIQIMVLGYLWLDALSVLILYNSLMTFSLYGVKIIGSLSMAWILVTVINLSCDVLIARGGGSVRGTMLLIVAQIMKVAIMLLWLVNVADLFGQSSSRIFAAMGIGGLALALAGKDTLENIFGTMVIMTTRPFAVGDWISFLGMDGTVENVGVRSTSIRTFYNSEVTIPNAKFITQPVDNMGRREWRRYKTFIGVAYDTPAENLNGYVQGLKQLVLNHPETNKTNFHIVVNDFGTSSINIMVYIFFKTADWAGELVARHKFIVDALRLAEQMKIQIAFPTTTVHLSQDDPVEYPEFQSDSHAESKGREFANAIRPVKIKE